MSAQAKSSPQIIYRQDLKMKLFRSASRSALQGFLAIAVFAASAHPQTKPKPAPIKSAALSGETAAEQRADRGLDVARSSPLALYAWLVKMPKGADLHNHLSGAIYAETWIRDAIDDHLCIDVITHSFAKPQAGSGTGPAPQETVCGKDQVPASQADADQNLYDALVDAFSMRGFVPSAGVTGHDHFFSTFGKFGGTDHQHFGEWLDEVAARAAAQNEQYLELMHTPAFNNAATAAGQAAWSEDFAQLREQLLAHGLRGDIAV